MKQLGHKIKKHLGLIQESAKFQLMSRMDTGLAFTFVTVGILIQFVITLVFFKAIYLRADTIGGWKVSELYILLGTYFLIEYIAWATYFRGFNKLPRFIKNGELDIYLSKPINIRHFFVYRYMDSMFVIPQLVVALGLIGYGILKTQHEIHLALYLVMLFCAFIIHYSVTVILGSVNFFFLIEHISFLQNELFSLGRFPMTIYKGIMRIVLSIIIPLAFIYTVPSRAIIGDLSLYEMLASICITLIFYSLSVFFWNFGLKRYESANG